MCNQTISGGPTRKSCGRTHFMTKVHRRQSECTLPTHRQILKRTPKRARESNLVCLDVAAEMQAVQWVDVHAIGRRGKLRPEVIENAKVSVAAHPPANMIELLSAHVIPDALDAQTVSEMLRLWQDLDYGAGCR